MKTAVWKSVASIFEHVLSGTTYFNDSAERTIRVSAEVGTVVAVTDPAGSYCAVKSPANVAIVVSTLEHLSEYHPWTYDELQSCDEGDRTNL